MHFIRHFIKYAMPCTLVALCGCSFLNVPQYDAIELDFQPTALNNEGVIAGLRVITPNFSEGGLWQDGEFTLLEAPDASPANPAYANPRFLSDDGVAVGRFGASSNAPAQVWVDFMVQELPPPSNAPELELQSIRAMNALGDLAGYALAQGELPVPQTVPVVHYADGTAEALPFFTPPGAAAPWRTFVHALNDEGIAVGSAAPNMTDSMISYPVIWEDGEVSRLPTPGFLHGSADSVNNLGWVTGSVHNNSSAWTPNLPFRDVVWIDGRMRQLRLHGASNSGRFILNDNGDILVNYREDLNDAGGAPYRVFPVLWRWDELLGRHFPVNLVEPSGLALPEAGNMRGLHMNNAGQITVAVFVLDEPSVLTEYYLLTPVE